MEEESTLTLNEEYLLESEEIRKIKDLVELGKKHAEIRENGSRIDSRYTDQRINQKVDRLYQEHVARHGADPVEKRFISLRLEGEAKRHAITQRKR